MIMMTKMKKMMMILIRMIKDLPISDMQLLRGLLGIPPERSLDGEAVAATFH